MDIQKINWKAFVQDPSAADPDAFFKVFNTWIPDSPEIFVDVADYQHAHDGPLTALIGHYADYWLDAADRRVGILYNRRLPADGSNAEKLQSSLRDLLRACARLERDPEFGGRLKFRTDELLFMINDRALAPNTPETFAAVRPDLEGVLTAVLGKNGFDLEHPAQPKKRFAVKITLRPSPDLGTLIGRLDGLIQSRA